MGVLKSLLEITITVYIGYVCIYNFVLSIAGLFYRRKSLSKDELNTHFKRRFAVFIPSYKEDGVIVDVARSALSQDYEADNYKVVVIADSLKAETLKRLRELPIEVVEVSFEQSTKVKALNIALDKFKGLYDAAVILDADNVMDRSFLRIMNEGHSAGHKALQGRRASKNESNDLAVLDGLSEEINNHINGKGNTVLHLSAALKGSGMSFDYELLRRNLADMHSVGGFDRELELRFLQEGTSVYYLPDAVVFDEKVEKSQVFQNQRKRWIASQYHYLAKYFVPGFEALLSGRFSMFNSAVLRNIQLPRLINLGLITVMVILALVTDASVMKTWLLLWGLFVISTLIAIPRSYINRRLFRVILSTPRLFLTMFLLLFKLKGANKKFIHTPHGSQ